MKLDVRQILWDSACAISDHLTWAATSPFDVPVELEERFNGGASPAVARHYSRVLKVRTLPDQAHILDLGCGYGRIAMELTRQLGPAQQYLGLDPSAEGIDWARRHIGSRYPNFRFERIDIRSRPYNPDGTVHGDTFRFPFADASLDLVFMISVLTHVDLPTVQTYVREAARVLKPATGRLVSTIFLLDDEVEALIADGRSRFGLPWSVGTSRVENRDNPELVIAHPRKEVLDILDAAGFAQVEVVDGHWSGRHALPMDFQDLLVADRTSGDEYRHPSSATTPPADSPSSLAIQSRLRDENFGTRDELMAFITWSVSVTLNALWWLDQGLTLTVDGAAGRPDLRFERFGELAIADPQARDTMTAWHFHPVDDGAVISLLQRAGGTADRDDMLACIHEAAHNGFLVLDAVRADRSIVLTSAGDGSRVAPIPVFARH